MYISTVELKRRLHRDTFTHLQSETENSWKDTPETVESRYLRGVELGS